MVAEKDDISETIVKVDSQMMIQNNGVRSLTTSNELELLYSLMFSELLNGTNPVVSKYSDVHAADAPNKRQQQHITPSTSTTVAV
ncbi:hypothetical protein Tco_0305735, partial [Tanacetum coccineum]